MIAHHQSSQNYEEWKEGKWSPDRALNHISEQLGFLPASDFCSSFEKLSDEKLSLFYDSLNTTPFSSSSCVLQLKARVELMWKKGEEEIAKKFSSSHSLNDSQLPRKKNENEEPENPTDDEEPTPNPSDSKEVILDTKGGSFYVTGDLPEKHFAFTFDDGPHESRTERLLDVLEKDKTLATFFVVGRMAQQRPEVVLKTAEKGHAIGNHSHTHANMPKLPKAKALAEIHKGFNSIYEALKGSSYKVAPFFRFPYGAHRADTRKLLKKENMGEFFWNIDTLDWKHRNPKKLFNYAMKQINKRGRGIILMHDVQEQTVIVVPWMIKAMKEKGYKTVVFRSKTPIGEKPFPISNSFL